MDKKKDGMDTTGGLSEEERELFKSMSPEEQKAIENMATKLSQEKIKNKSSKEDLDIEEHRALVASMLPNGNVRPLFESEICLLCQKEAQKRTCYAVTDMGNKEPEGTKPTALMIRVKTKIGSILPLQIACCDRCKRNHRIDSLIMMLIMLITLGVGLFVLSRSSVAAALYSVNKGLSFIIFLALIPISFGVGKLLRVIFRKKAEKETIFNVCEIPFVVQLTDRGWFPLNTNAEKEPTLVFSKEKLKKGWFID